MTALFHSSISYKSRSLWVLCGLFFSGLLSAQQAVQPPTYELKIVVRNVAVSQGSIRVALYQEEATFLDFEGVAVAAVAPAEQGETVVTFKGLAAGQYAAALYHDRNDNEEMDTNWLGIPKEALGFSKARLRSFGPPKFKDCLFEVAAPTSLIIPLENN